MDSVKISIIVPAYNVAQYLEKCINSLLNQTYHNIEIICVDDGSTDETAIILAKLSSSDERIKPIYTKNSGVSAARNRALSLSTGDFIMFVDGDDWIEPDTCASALKALLDESADLVLWGYTREYPARSLPKLVFPESRVLNEQDCAELWRRMVGLIDAELRYPENADAFSCVWGKLYRRSDIMDSKICFMDLKDIGTYEDGLFNLKCLSRITKAVYIARPLYHYRKGSGMTASYREKLLEQWKNLFAEIQHYIDTTACDKALFYRALHNRISLSIIGLGLNSIGLPFRKAYRNIHTILHDSQYRSAIQTLPLRFFPVHWWLFFLFAKLNCTVGVFLLLKCIRFLQARQKA